VNGLHVQGMSEDEGDAVVFTPVGDPVPGEHALDADDNVVLQRLDSAGQGGGEALMCLCSRSSPLSSRMQTYRDRACRSTPQ
jgi:hypothetical protein